ncbi:MAG: class I SAM-dependent methyltransferase [Kofleriaceae bacterium]
MTRPPAWREVAAGYDAAAAGYDQRHDDPPTAARARVIDRVLVGATRGATTVVEIGVGTGRLLAQVAAPTRIGVDVSARMLAVAHARGLAVVRADGHALPLADGAVDAVIAGKGSLRYLAPALALAECARVLRPGGVVAFHLYGGRTWRPGHVPAPPTGLWEPASTSALRATLATAGFQVQRLVLLRPIRIYPYFIVIPAMVDRRSPVQLWSHVAVVARRPIVGPP